MVKNRVCHQFFIGNSAAARSKKADSPIAENERNCPPAGEREGEGDYATFSNFLRMAKMKSAETRQMPASTLQMTTRLTFAPHIRPGIMTS